MQISTTGQGSYTGETQKRKAYYIYMYIYMYMYVYVYMYTCTVSSGHVGTGKQRKQNRCARICRGTPGACLT